MWPNIKNIIDTQQNDDGSCTIVRFDEDNESICSSHNGENISIKIDIWMVFWLLWKYLWFKIREPWYTASLLYDCSYRNIKNYLKEYLVLVSKRDE